ncbi:MAG: iron-containing alcohol dehydrogenase [Clostridia bacterium]|nr:iron-containing alcohol dehydrogenase [Clostridia bacterium]
MKNDILSLIRSLEGECACGGSHTCTVRDIVIESGAVRRVGEILKRNGFPTDLLIVADKNTLVAAEGIIDSLDGFNIEYKIYDSIRVAEMSHVRELEDIIRGRDMGILSVGTGSVNDPCRLAAARQDKMLCIFATAPSMDGFASYSSPIVDGGFKLSYPAKTPEVIIGDTRILADAPTELKSAGFGDMIAKYVGLVDWQVSHILTGEVWCEKVASLTREATDELVAMADLVTSRDEATAGKIFESLLKTGVGMSFMQNSRPASGSEHIVAHLIECIELRDGKIPNYHGDDVGVCTLEVLKLYSLLAEMPQVKAHAENVDWDEIFDYYGSMRDDVYGMNFPTSVTDGITPELIVGKWDDVRGAIKSVPSYEECLDAMRRAGCKITADDIGKSRRLVDDCIKYSPFMRRRMTLLRLQTMVDM